MYRHPSALTLCLRLLRQSSRELLQESLSKNQCSHPRCLILMPYRLRRTSEARILWQHQRRTLRSKKRRGIRKLLPLLTRKPPTRIRLRRQSSLGATLNLTLPTGMPSTLILADSPSIYQPVAAALFRETGLWKLGTIRSRQSLGTCRVRWVRRKVRMIIPDRRTCLRGLRVDKRNT